MIDWRRLVSRTLVAVTLTAGTAHAQAADSSRGTPPSVYIEELTWPEIRDAIQAGRTTALIYVGSTEQSGPHMVLGKHTFRAHYLAGAIAIALGNALVYPVLPFALTGDVATKTEHMRFPGSVSLTGPTLQAVVQEVARSAVAAGFREVYIMGDHGGGQAELKRAAAAVQAEVRARGVRVAYLADVYYRATAQMQAYCRAHGIPIGSHAGAEDTGMLMAIDSTHRWIRRDKLVASDSTQFAVTGVSGDATRATPELGRIFLDYKIQDAVAEIRAIRATP